MSYLIMIVRSNSFARGRPFPTVRDPFSTSVLDPNLLYLHDQPLFVGQTFLANGSRVSRETYLLKQAMLNMPGGCCEAYTFEC